jgi:hypothetical protein
MKKLLTAVITVHMLSIGWVPSALAVQSGTPVDFRACNFRDGKDMQDLNKVGAKFREYANKNDIHYSAWALIPQYQTNIGFDLGWLGAWPDGEAFGVSMEKWTTTASHVRAEFNEVLDCSSRHEMSVSLPINATAGTPEDGVLMFYQCSLHEGKTLADAYKGHLEAGTAMKGMGSLAVSWMFQPSVGAGDIDFDYYHVLGFYRYSDLGATLEMYVNNGGQQAQQEILGSTRSCETPVVYDAISMRAGDER